MQLPRTMNFARSIGYKIAALLAGIILISQVNSFGEFTIQGVETYGSSGQKRPHMRYNVIVESRDDGYRITAKAIDGDRYNDEVTAGDGVDNYFLSQTWPSLDAKHKNEGYGETGSVINGNFPKSSMTMVQLLWVVYCQAPHFEAGTNHLSIPLHSTQDARADALTQVVAFRTDIPSCLNKIQCFAPGYLIFTDQNDREIGNKLKPPYDKGYLLWEINVTSITNVGNLILPSSFEYFQYFPQDGVLECVTKGAFVLKDVSNKVIAQRLLPVATDSKVNVADWRFNHTALAIDKSGEKGTPVIVYKLTGDNWLQSNNPTMTHKMIALKTFVHDRSPAKANPPVKFAAYLAFTVLAFLLAYFVRLEMETKRNNKQTNK